MWILYFIQPSSESSTDDIIAIKILYFHELIRVVSLSFSLLGVVRLFGVNERRLLERKNLFHINEIWDDFFSIHPLKSQQRTRKKDTWFDGKWKIVVNEGKKESKSSRGNESSSKSWKAKERKWERNFQNGMAMIIQRQLDSLFPDEKLLYSWYHRCSWKELWVKKSLLKEKENLHHEKI